MRLYSLTKLFVSTFVKVKVAALQVYYFFFLSNVHLELWGRDGQQGQSLAIRGDSCLFKAPQSGPGLPSVGCDAFLPQYRVQASVRRKL